MVEQVDVEVEKVPKKEGRKPKNLTEEKLNEKYQKNEEGSLKERMMKNLKFQKKRGRKPKDSNVTKTFK